MKTLKILACMLVMLGMGQTAQAAFMMTVEDTTVAGSALTISDNGAGDGSALTDAIVFSGAVGNFMLNVNVGAFADRHGERSEGG